MTYWYSETLFSRLEHTPDGINALMKHLLPTCTYVASSMPARPVKGNVVAVFNALPYSVR